MKRSIRGKKTIPFFRKIMQNKRRLFLHLLYQAFFMLFLLLFTSLVLVSSFKFMIPLIGYFSDAAGTNITALDAYRDIKGIFTLLNYWFIGVILYFIFLEGILWLHSHMIIKGEKINYFTFMKTYVLQSIISFALIFVILFIYLSSQLKNFVLDESIAPFPLLPLLLILLIAYFLLVSFASISKRGIIHSFKAALRNGIIKFLYYAFAILSYLLVSFVLLLILFQVGMFFQYVIFVIVLLLTILLRLVMVEISGDK